MCLMSLQDTLSDLALATSGWEFICKWLYPNGIGRYGIIGSPWPLSAEVSTVLGPAVTLLRRSPWYVFVT